MNGFVKRCWLIGCLCVLGCMLISLGALAGPTSAPRGAVKADAKFYIINTDVDDDILREAIARMIAMGQEYSNRTRGYSGAIPGKMPFDLFTNPEQYSKAGGPPGSCGVYNGKSLMAIASKQMLDNGQLWHTVQHEGFHQFAAKVITTNLPIWSNEGMAEYFGEALWTGDGLTCGIIPPYRCKRIQEMIKDQKIKPFREFLAMSHADWNKNLNLLNYDQAWSMVHFLVHADNGRYQAGFVKFINEVAHGANGLQAFAMGLGRDVDLLQKRYCDWWTALGENPTEDVYQQVAVETLTCFLGRALVMKQKFETSDEFFDAARNGKIAIDPQKFAPPFWLPPSLLDSALKRADKLHTWSLLPAEPGKYARLKLTLDDGTVMIGSFGVAGQTVTNVRVAVTKPKASATPAAKPAAGMTTSNSAP